MDDDQNGLTGREPGLKREHDQTDGPVLGGEHRLLHAIEHLQDKNSKIRERAIAVLDEFGNEQVVNRLAVALYDRNKNLRDRASEALGKIGGEQARQILLETIQNENLDVSIRCAAISGLGYCADDPAIDLLFNYMGHENTTFHSYARYALIKVGEPVVPRLQTTLQSENIHQRAHALEALTWIYMYRFWNHQDKEWTLEHYRNIEAFAAEEEEILRRVALWSAMKMNDPYFMDLFKKHLLDKYHQAWEYSFKGLAGIGKRYLHDPERKEKIFQVFFDGIHDSDFLLRNRYFFIFHEIGPDVIPDLIKHWDQAHHDQKDEVFEVIQGMGSVIVEQSNDLLNQAPGKREKRLVVDILLRLPHQIDGLISLAQREEKWIRQQALEVLGKEVHSGGYRAVQTVTNIAETETDIHIKRKALKALGKIGLSLHFFNIGEGVGQALHTRVVAVLQEQAASSDLEGRVEAVRALGSLQNPALISFLVSHLETCQGERRYYEAAETTRSLALFARETPVARALLQAFEASDHAYLRRSCLKALNSSSDPDLLSRLIAALDTIDRDEHVHLIRTLYIVASRVEDEASIPNVVTALEDLMDESNPYILTHIIRGLGRLRATSLTPKLQSFLASECIDIQRAAVYALAHTNDESAIPHVLTALQRTDQTILRHAISACSRLRIRAALPRLIELTHHDNPIIEDAAILALGQFPEEEAIQRLVNLAIDTEDWHSLAEYAMRQIGEPATAALIDRLQNASTTKQKARILRLLDHLRSEGDLPEHFASTLKDLVRHTEHEMASAAASCAAHRSLEIFTVPELAELLNHDDYGVWYFAINALGQRRTDEALSHLVDVYVTRKDPINYHALSSIYNYDMSQAIGLIVEHSEITDEAILDFSSHLTYQGQTLDDPRILAALLRLLEHGSNHNRIRTIDLLGTHFMAETASVLRTLLNDMSDEVRAAAIRALARHGDLDIDTLLDRIQDPSGADFGAAVWELSHYDDPRITPALLAVLREVEDSSQKWQIIQALGRTREPAVVPMLAGLLHDEDMRPHRLSILQMLTEFDTDEARAAVEAWCSGEGS